MDLEPLKEAGLTEGEIKVYLALLELGSTTTGPIVKQSGIAKSIVYQILDKLMQKGMVSMVVKQKTKHFQASDPQKLLEYIDERKENIEKNRMNVEQLLPRLLAKQSLTERSETRMYFGFRGMTTAHEHLYDKLRKGEEYIYLGVPAYQPEAHHLYWKRDHERRVKTGITCRLLFNADTDIETVKQRSAYKDAEARRMSEDIVTPAMIAIFKDTVVITVQHPEVVSVEIINQQVADSFKGYFEHFWRRSDRP